MKKIPSPGREEMNSSAQAKQPSPATASSADPEDAFAGLQADLDRFRDLALRSQADFENYKKRAAREKEDAINTPIARCSSAWSQFSTILSWVWQPRKRKIRNLRSIPE